MIWKIPVFFGEKLRRNTPLLAAAVQRGRWKTYTATAGHRYP
jgi:hypothetical protein